MLFCFLDTETTGFSPKENGLVQLSGCIEKDGVIVEKFDYKIRPVREDCVFLKQAEEKTGYTKQVVAGFDDPYKCFEQFYNLIAKYGDPFAKKTDPKILPVGYNVSFDVDFLIQWFRDCAQTEEDRKFGNSFFNFFYVPGLDVMQIALASLMEKRIGMENFQLGTVCKKFGLKWEDEKAHEGLYDVKKTRALFHTITNRRYLNG